MGLSIVVNLRTIHYYTEVFIVHGVHLKAVRTSGWLVRQQNSEFIVMHIIFVSEAQRNNAGGDLSLVMQSPTSSVVTS